MGRPVRVGFVGTGDVMLKYYLPAVLRAPDAIQVVAICDDLPGRAEKVAEAFGVRDAFADYGQMLHESDAELVVNLTPAQLHFRFTLAALEAGKHVYVEKPMARTLDEADTLLATARAKGVRLMAAPTLMLDPVNQTVRRLIREETVGKVAFAVANAFQGGPLGPSYIAGHERALARAGVRVLNTTDEKTDPSWFYQRGGGPLYDIGVYRITLLTGLLGPARRVTALSGIRTAERTVSWGLGQGRTFTTDEDDNTLLLLDFGDAAFACVSASWHGTATESPQLEVVCQRGTIAVPRTQPDGRTVVRVHDGEDWREEPVEGEPWTIPSGLPRFARDVASGASSPVDIEQARHVVEVMEKALVSARSGTAQALTTTFRRAAEAETR
jgi:predicted dehydrogenase